VAAFENKEFTFTDSTLIVETNNPGNTGPLGSLNSTVVFFDNAEGEMQPYYEKQSFVGYYHNTAYPDLDGTTDTSYYRTYYYCHAPKNGSKSIAIGGTTSAKLHLRVTLSKAAKLSFWYANKKSNTTGECSFSINGSVKNTWTSDIDWSFIEADLTAGVNDLVWQKGDGYYSSYPSSYYYYLALDDILVVYTQ
jgi:hypothetical protein